MIAFFLFLFFMRAGAQTPTVTLPILAGCPGDSLTAPIAITHFNAVGAITLFIAYDTSVVLFKGSGNPNPQFPGLIVNAVSQPQPRIKIAWSSLNPGTVASGNLVELYFEYLGDSCGLNFTPDCEIANAFLVPIPFIANDGRVDPHPPYIIENPVNVVVTEGEDAQFTVIASGADTYQWQENLTGTWTHLQNGLHYQNVNTSQLTILQTPLSFNQRWYRCFMTATGGCEVVSDSARLKVLPYLTGFLSVADTMGCPVTDVSVPLSGFGLDSISSFAINVAYNPQKISFVDIGNIAPVLQGISYSLQTSPVPHVQFLWNTLSPTGISIPDGILFDMIFHLDSGSSPLVLLESCNVTRYDNLIYNLETEDGLLSEDIDPQIISHPADTIVKAGQSAHFKVLASNAIAYQWYESQDQGQNWIELITGYPYFGVNTAALIVAGVTASFDQFQYQCRIWGERCEKTSLPAILTVDTLTRLEEILTSGFQVLSFTAANESVEILVAVDFPGSLVTEFYNLQGVLLYRDSQSVLSNGRVRIQKKGVVLPAGIYLVKISLSGSPLHRPWFGKVFLR